MPTIVEQYVAAAREHGKCTETGNYKSGNKAYDRIIAAIREMRKLPDRGEVILTELLFQPDDWVKMWAATHLLPLREAAASTVLARLASVSPGLLRADADMVLKEWRAGRLKID
jgi:hypothetical protein